MFNGTGVTSIEFTSKRACEEAIEQVKQIQNETTKVEGVCVEKRK